MARDKKSGPERTAEAVAVLRQWQGIERDAIETTAQIMEKTDNLLIRQIMEIIRNDSVQHHRVQQFLIDSMTKTPITLQARRTGRGVGPDSRPTMSSSGRPSNWPRTSRVKASNPVTNLLLDYLLRDEQKHDTHARRSREVQTAHVEDLLSLAQETARSEETRLMGLLKKKDKKKSGKFESRLKGGGGGGGSQLSALRPRYVESLPPCTGNCPSGNDIRGWLTVIQLREKLGLSLDEACEQAFRMEMETNPFPSVMGRVCPHPCETGCNRGKKDGVGRNQLGRTLSRRLGPREGSQGRDDRG